MPKNLYNVEVKKNGELFETSIYVCDNGDIFIPTSDEVDIVEVENDFIIHIKMCIFISKNNLKDLEKKKKIHLRIKGKSFEISIK